MFLIVGLGNPGKEYDGTRHNIGFAAIDYIADKYNIELNRIKFKGVFGEGLINGKKVILLKPTTYMNLSGESIREVHNGIKSIIANLGTDVFPRVKIGVGAPKGNLVSHVLGKFSDEEVEILRESIKASSDATSIIISNNTKEAMNKLNGFNAGKEK